MGGRWSLVQIQSPRPFSFPGRPPHRVACSPATPHSMIAILGYTTAALVVRLLPEPWTDRMGVGLARLLFALRLPARRALEANLERLLGPDGRTRVRGTARESFEQFALAFTDFLRLDRSHPERLERGHAVYGREHLAAARASGRGVILVSAHVGS